MAKKPREPKGSWIVRMRRTITSEIVCDNCTEEQARSSPYTFADAHQDETEIDCHDFDVLSVEPNA